MLAEMNWPEAMVQIASMGVGAILALGFLFWLFTMTRD